MCHAWLYILMEQLGNKIETYLHRVLQKNFLMLHKSKVRWNVWKDWSDPIKGETQDDKEARG